MTTTARRRERAAWREQLERVDPVPPASALFGLTPAGPAARKSVDIPVADANHDLARLAGDSPLRLLAPVAAAAALVMSRYSRRDDLLVAVTSPMETEGIVPVWLPSAVARTRGALVAETAVALRGALAAAPSLPPEIAALVDHGDAGTSLAVSYSGLLTPPRNCEVAVVVLPEASGPRLRVEYDSARVPATLASRVARHLARVLTLILTDPSAAVDEITLLDEEETRQVLELGTGERGSEPSTLHERVRTFARTRPDRRALVYRDRVLTYAQLHRAALAVADQLAVQGIKAGDRVAVLLERGDLPVVAVLGTFLAGAVYVPTDTAHPEARISFMLADCAAAAVITEPGQRERVPPGFIGPICVLGDPADLAERDAPERLGPTAEAPAYAIYTSGTTGQPKAVLITHAACASTCEAYRTAYQLGDDEVCLQLGSFAFDVFNGDLGRSLHVGGTLVVCPDEARSDVDALLELIVRHRVSILESTPALVNPLAEALATDGEARKSLRTLISSADVWRTEDYLTVRKLIGEEVRVFNTYGVTEAAIDSTVFPPDDEEDGRGRPYACIGRPMRGVVLRVVDPRLRLMPVGLPGELCIGGDAVGSGYLGRPGMTADRFVPDPFGTGGRLYRTGDLVRLLPGGQVEYLGRVDHQMKIRGFRVEFGEVETVLRGHPAVREAVAVARDDGKGSARLAAYLICQGTVPSVVELREHCLRALPAYMVPSVFAVLDAMPLNRNGKVDRAALPEPGLGQPELGVDFVEPRTEAEREVAAIWAEVLKVNRVGVSDDFFAVGGHSVLAMRLVARLAENAGPRLPVRAVFDQPTVAGLARLLEKARLARVSEKRTPVLKRYDRSEFGND